MARWTIANIGIRSGVTSVASWKDVDSMIALNGFGREVEIIGINLGHPATPQHRLR